MTTSRPQDDASTAPGTSTSKDTTDQGGLSTGMYGTPTSKDTTDQGGLSTGMYGTSTSNDTTDEGGLPTGVIIGVTVTAVVLTIAVVILIIICCVRRRRRPSPNRPGSSEMPSPGDVDKSIRNASDDASWQSVHSPRAPAPAPAAPQAAPSQPEPPKDNAVKNINLKSDRDYENIPKPRVESGSGKEVPPCRVPMENSNEIPPVPSSRTQPTATGRSSLKDDHVDHSHTIPSRMHVTSPPLDPPSDSSLPPPPQPHKAAVHRYVNERKPSLPAVKPVHEYDINDFDTHSLNEFCSLDSLPSQPAPPPPNMYSPSGHDPSAIISNTPSHGTTPHGDYFPMIPEELMDTSSVDGYPSLNSLPSGLPPPPPNEGGKDSRFPSQPPNMFSTTPVVSPSGHDPSAIISNTASHGTSPHGDCFPMIPDDLMDTSSFDNYPSLSSMPSVEPPPPPTVGGFLAQVPLDLRGGRQTTNSYINQGYDPESKLNTPPASEEWYLDMRVKAKH